MLGTAAAGGGLAFYKLADVKTQFELISAAGPIYRLMDAELTHVLGIEAAKWGMFPKETRPDPPVLKTKLWNKEFSNPIGKELMPAWQLSSSTPCMQWSQPHHLLD